MIVDRFKRLLAILILACFFLPLTHCEYKAAPSVDARSALVLDSEDFVPVETIKFKTWDELPLALTFIWPVLAALLSWRAKRQLTRAMINAMGLLLSVVSIGLIAQTIRFEMAFGAYIRYGGVTVLTCLGGDLMASAYILIQQLRWRISRAGS